jgi:hypothetical protein
MTRGRNKSNEGPSAVPQDTALVPHPQLGGKPWTAERPPPFAEEPEAPSPQDAPSYEKELNTVWAKLRGEWSWVVVMPSEPDYRTTDIGRALSRVGARLSVYPVELIDANAIDVQGSTRLLAHLGISAGGVRTHGKPVNGEPFASSDWAPPITRTIVALESPLANPLVIPIALAAQGIVLCVRRGRDRIASVRETIEAVGAHLIVCCVLLE